MTKQTDQRLDVERLGGFAGFGVARSHLKSVGTVALAQLSAVDREAIEALFRAAPRAAAPKQRARDAFIYRLTCTIGGKAQTIDVAEDQVPQAVRESVRDTLE